MKLGINTLLWTAAFGAEHLPLLPKLKEAGFDGVEIARFDFTGFPAAEIRRALQAHDLGVTFCSAATGAHSLICEDAAQRARTIEFLKQGIATAAELGSDMLMGPFCSAVGYLCGRRRTDTEWQRAIEGLQALTETLDAHQVTLVLEPLNRFETYFLNTTADAIALCEAVNHPRVKLMVDTFHANIEEKCIGEAIRNAAPYLHHVHTCENDRGIPGTGHIEWTSIFRALQTIRYDRWVVIESFGAAIPEIAAAACIWRDLAPNSEDIALQGVQFLKQHLA